MDVYWSQPLIAEEFTDLLIEPLDNLLLDCKKRKDVNFGKYLKCYSAISELKNTFIFRSPFDLGLKISKYGLQTDRYGQNFAENIYHHADENCFTLLLNIYFFSENYLKVEQMPPIYHESPFNKDFYFSAGSFDISSWFRPFQPGFIHKDLNQEKIINIKKGDPLAYFKFHTDEGINFIEYETTETLIKFSMNCASYKIFKPKTPLKILYENFNKRSYSKKILAEIKNNLI